MASGRSRRERDLEMFRRMKRERLMRRRGYDREYYREMEMEMMMYEREMMYRLHGEDFEFEFEEPPEPSEDEIKRQDRQELLYYINTQMLPGTVRVYGNAHDVHDDICRFVREGRFKTVLEDQKRFQVNYVTLREVPTERDLLLELCRFAIASFNYRELDYEKIFVLLCGIEEDLETKVYPLSVGLPYLKMGHSDEIFTAYKKLLKRGGTRRHGLKDSEFSSIDEGMTRFTIVQSTQKACKHTTPIPPVGVLSVHPAWVFCHEYCYLFGTVDENRRWRPRIHGFVKGRAVPLTDVELIYKIETRLSQAYDGYRKSKYY